MKVLQFHSLLLISIIVAPSLCTFFNKRIGVSTNANPFEVLSTDNEILCAIMCSRRDGCDSYMIDHGACNLFKNSADNMTYNPASTIQNTYGFNIDIFSAPRPGSLPNISGFWGTYGPVKYCPKGSAISSVAIMYDMYNGTSMNPDDGGVTQINVHCSDVNSQFTDSLTLGPVYPASTLRGPVVCPGRSKVWGARVSRQAGVLGSSLDDVGMSGFEVECNDALQTRFILADAAEYNALGDSIIWSSWMYCQQGFSICGMAVRIEAPNYDNTCINEISIQCCFV